MRRARITVVGAGALGSALLQRLLRQGFARVCLVDADVVEPRNLPLSPFLQTCLGAAADVPAEPLHRNVINGDAIRTKVGVIAAMAQHSAGLPWRAFPAWIADVGWQDLASADLVCCCTDSALSRVETTLVARALGKPMLDGAVFGDGIPEGRVSVFPVHEDAACYLCGLREDRRAAILASAASSSVGCRPPEQVSRMTGTLATLNATADAMMEAVCATLHRQNGTAALRGAQVVRLRGRAGLSESGMEWTRETVNLTRSSTCPWHDAGPVLLQPLPWEQPLRASIEPGWQLVFTWPVCSVARCTHCGLRTEPMVRLGRVRELQCSRCGEQMLEPMESLERVCHGDRWCDASPRQLGQPERHLYCLSQVVRSHT